MPADAGPADPARTVGFVGIGNMGWPMAANLVRAGLQVAVTDAVSGRAARFAIMIGGSDEDVERAEPELSVLQPDGTVLDDDGSA